MKIADLTALLTTSQTLSGSKGISYAANQDKASSDVLGDKNDLKEEVTTNQVEGKETDEEDDDKTVTVEVEDDIVNKEESEEEEEEIYMCSGCFGHGPYAQECDNCWDDEDGYSHYDARKLNQEQCDHLDELAYGPGDMREQKWFVDMVTASMAENGQVYYPNPNPKRNF